jgi:hypothetical protein
MTVKRLAVEGLTGFCVTFVVSIAVTLVWNVVFHGTHSIDWETSGRFAIVWGILVPWLGTRRAGEGTGSR